MADTAASAALVVAVLNGIAALYGAWCWWSVRTSRVFWVLVRVAQASAVALAAIAGIGAVTGFAPASGLFWLYALLPLAVGFVAEQFRYTAAQTVLDARGLEDDAGQRSVVLAILRREIGVMALAAIVVAFLALRAYGTA